MKNKLDINWFNKGKTTYLKYDLNEYYSNQKWILNVKNTQNAIEYFLKLFEINYKFLRKVKHNYFEYKINNKKNILINATCIKPYMEFYKDPQLKKFNSICIETYAKWDNEFIGKDIYKLSFDIVVVNGKIIKEKTFFTLNKINHLMNFKGKKKNKSKESGKIARLSLSQISKLSTKKPVFYFENRYGKGKREIKYGIFSYMKLLNKNTIRKFQNYLLNDEIDKNLIAKSDIFNPNSMPTHIINNGIKKRNPKLHSLFCSFLEMEVHQHKYFDMLNTIEKDSIEYKHLFVNSHIKPIADKTITSAEIADRNNGLYLTNFHDSLFDKKYITFSSKNGRVILSKVLSNSNEFHKLKDLKIDNAFLTKKRKTYLQIHNIEFEKKNY